MASYRAPETAEKTETAPLRLVSGGIPPEAPQADPTAERDDLIRRARQYAEAAKSPNTRLAYESDWRHFEDWCQMRRREPLPASPETLSLYLAFHSRTLRPSTLQRRMATISRTHRAAGAVSPTGDAAVRDVLAGILRERAAVGEAGPQHKAPLLREQIEQIVLALPDTLIGRRDKALLLLGWACALRRSEIVALTVGDVAFVPQGMVVTVRKSKTDQTGEGHRIGVPFARNPETCPVLSSKAWLESTGIKTGPLFRPLNRHGRVADTRLMPQSIWKIVKRLTGGIGLDENLFGAHSLRAGLATSAAQMGATEREIRDITGHKSERMLRRYIRDGELFSNNAIAKTGL